MSTVIFANASILDGSRDAALPDHHVLVEDGTIRESRTPHGSRSAHACDHEGRPLRQECAVAVMRRAGIASPAFPRKTRVPEEDLAGRIGQSGNANSASPDPAAA
jgi:hypothetical protein